MSNVVMVRWLQDGVNVFMDPVQPRVRGEEDIMTPLQAKRASICGLVEIVIERDHPEVATLRSLISASNTKKKTAIEGNSFKAAEKFHKGVMKATKKLKELQKKLVLIDKLGGTETDEILKTVIERKEEDIS